jgi:hypothetical protein
MTHWAQQYVGTPYSEHDCAQLAVRVLHEQFGRTINLPTERAANVRGISQQIDTLHDDYATPVTLPMEGDAVLMIGRGRLNHIGIYCEINGEAWVLHAVRNAGHACLHKLHNLGGIGLEVEGFYRWK